MPLSLYASESAPRTRKLSTSLGDLEVIEAPPRPLPSTSRDAELLAILTAPLAEHETIERGFARKERELLAVLAQLSVIEAFHLRARLVTPRDTDELAARFSRLCADRRTRLVRFIADTRRRTALAQAGR